MKITLGDAVRVKADKSVGLVIGMVSVTPRKTSRWGCVDDMTRTRSGVKIRLDENRVLTLRPEDIEHVAWARPWLKYSKRTQHAMIGISVLFGVVIMASMIHSGNLIAESLVAGGCIGAVTWRALVDPTRVKFEVNKEDKS
jgi:hypothetical protein